MVVRWGEEVIGALVLGWADEVGGGRRGKGRGKKCGRGVVRAWTVRLKYRGKGVGEGLLEEAVRVCMERGAEGVEFADDHASELAPFFPIFFLGGGLLRFLGLRGAARSGLTFFLHQIRSGCCRSSITGFWTSGIGGRGRRWRRLRMRRGISGRGGR